MGYNSKIILSGRKLNDGIPENVCDNVFNFFKKQEKKNLKILILGITFKENCSDTRNSKVIDIYKILVKNKLHIEICDPFAIEKDVKKQYNISLIKVNQIKSKYYDGILVCVGHKQFLNLDLIIFIFYIYRLIHYQKINNGLWVANANIV